MDVIDKAIARLKTLNNEVEDLILEVAEENKGEIIELNRTQLRDHGINSDGVKIASYKPYAPSTVLRKKKKGQPTERVTLLDEGDFQGSFYAKRVAEGLEVGSSDRKTEWLVNKYGEKIFDLTRENLEYISDKYITPKLQEKIIKKLK